MPNSLVGFIGTFECCHFVQSAALCVSIGDKISRRRYNATALTQRGRDYRSRAVTIFLTGTNPVAQLMPA